MPNLYIILTMSILFISTTSYAEMYKWTDNKGQVHYTQTPPPGVNAEQMKAPPPPTVNPNKAQREIESLIRQQKQLDQQREHEKQLEKHKEVQKKNDEKRCEAAKSNLDNFKNNPSRKVRNEDGSVTPLTEEVRQQRIKFYQDRVNIYCQ